ATHVSFEVLGYLAASGSGSFVEQRLSHHHESRGAETTLECEVLNEGRLDGVEFVTVGHSLDGGHLLAVDIGSKVRACTDRKPVDQDGAGATYLHLATQLGAGQSQVVAEELCQGKTGNHSVDGDPSVNCGGDGDLAH